MNMRTKILGMAVVAALACATVQANIISVNITKAGEANVSEPYGIAAEGSVASNWENVTVATSNLGFSDGSASSVDLAVVKGPSFNIAYPSEYAGTPLGVGIQENLTQTPHSSMTFSDLNANFADGYKAIVYLTGASACNAASVTDGTTTYYYKTLWTPGNFNGTLTETTDTTYVGGDSTSVPVAQYAVFGSEAAPLTADSITFTMDALLNSAAGIGGVQIVAIPEPATFGLVVVFGGAVFGIRRIFKI